MQKNFTTLDALAKDYDEVLELQDMFYRLRAEAVEYYRHYQASISIAMGATPEKSKEIADKAEKELLERYSW